MRALRNLAEGATYHVASKIAHDAMALQEPALKEAFLDFIVKAKERFPFDLWNFTVMDNHIHLLITPGPEVSLSKIMQWIKCNFAKWWNKRHKTKGHLWGERFFSRIIEDEADFQRVSEYIDNNPVRANLVKTAEAWRFGGLFHRTRRMFGVIDRLSDPATLFAGGRAAPDTPTGCARG